jgi:dynein heavy chain
MIDDFWGPSKRILSDPKFIENLSNLDKDTISAKTAKHIRDKYLSNPDINPDKSKSTVVAMDVMARALYRFVLSVSNRFLITLDVIFLFKPIQF